MKKVIVVFLLLLGLLFPLTASAVSQSFSWIPNTESDLAGYYVLIRHIFEEFDPSKEVWRGEGEIYDGRVHCTIAGDLGNGIYYAVGLAYSTAGLSSNYSQEVRFEIKDGEYIYGEVRIEETDDGVNFFLPDPDEAGVAGYKIYYTVDNISEVVDIGTATEYFLELDDGLYSFDIVPYNEAGDEFPNFTLAWNYFFPSMETPDLKVSAVGIGLTKILVGIEPSDDDRIERYDYYLSSSFAKALAGEADIGEGSSYNRNIVHDVSSTDYDMVFITIVPVNETYEVSGNPEIAYVLFGNIIGTYDDGVQWNEADVYYADYNAFKQKYRSTVERPELEDYVSLDLYNLLPLTITERSDFSGNGYVYYEDYNFLKAKYKHFGSNYAE